MKYRISKLKNEYVLKDLRKEVFNGCESTQWRHVKKFNSLKEALDYMCFKNLPNLIFETTIAGCEINFNVECD
jgi:hypothetical protein